MSLPFPLCRNVACIKVTEVLPDDPKILEQMQRPNMVFIKKNDCEQNTFGTAHSKFKLVHPILKSS